METEAKASAAGFEQRAFVWFRDGESGMTYDVMHECFRGGLNRRISSRKKQKKGVKSRRFSASCRAGWVLRCQQCQTLASTESVALLPVTD